MHAIRRYAVHSLNSQIGGECMLRPRSVRKVVVTFAVVWMAAFVSSDMASAAGLSGVAVARSPWVTAKCTFAVSKVDWTTRTATASVTLQARPTTSSGYVKNIYTEIFCDLYPIRPLGDLLDHEVAVSNGPVIPRTSVIIDVPYFPNYEVCTTAYVKLRSGIEHGPIHQCSA